MFSQKKTVETEDVNKGKGLAVWRLFLTESSTDLEIPSFFIYTYSCIYGYTWSAFLSPFYTYL